MTRAIGVDEMTIARWERADSWPPQYAKLKRLRERVGLDYAGTVERSGPSPSDEPGFGVTT